MRYLLQIKIFILGMNIDFVKRELKDSQLFFASIKEIDCEKTLYFHEVAIENYSVSFADDE